MLYFLPTKLYLFHCLYDMNVVRLYKALADSLLHLYSRHLIDLCIKAEAGMLLLVNQTNKQKREDSGTNLLLPKHFCILTTLTNFLIKYAGQ